MEETGENGSGVYVDAFTFGDDDEFVEFSVKLEFFSAVVQIMMSLWLLWWTNLGE